MSGEGFVSAVLMSPSPERIYRQGYCTECANALLKYVGSLLAREK